MLDTSARLLHLLSLLQTRREWSGAALAERLDITTRTVRRDVDRLRELGYPVDATVGVGGGYRLGAGAQMPPLLLSDDEVVAVAIGLQSGASASVTGVGDATEHALAKLRQVMPSRLRHRLDALQIEVTPHRAASTSVEADALTLIATACHNHERLRFDYETHNGERSRREIEPHRLVRSGLRWYLVGWDLMRDEWRSFRVDRLEPKTPTGPTFGPRELPEGGAAEFVAAGIDRAHSKVRARVTIREPIDVIAPMIDPQWGTVESVDDTSCAVSIGGSSYAIIAQWLAAFDADFEVQDCPELTRECRLLAERHHTTARRYERA